MRDKSPLFLAIALLAIAPIDAMAAHGSRSATAPAEAVALGTSTVELNGPWKYAQGDSTWQGDAAEWAEPNFDDSRWDDADLAASTDTESDSSQKSGKVQSNESASGYAWYRLRLQVANPAQPMALLMPKSFDGAYELYANGKYVGQFGRFTTKGVQVFTARPQEFELPAVPADGRLELAVRIFAPQSAANNITLLKPPVMGKPAEIGLLAHVEKDAVVHAEFGEFLTILVALLLTPLTILALARARRGQMWLWLASALTLFAAIVGLNAMQHVTAWVARDQAGMWSDGLLIPLCMLGWTLFWWRWFRLRFERWIPMTACLLAAMQIYARFAAVHAGLSLGAMAPQDLHWFDTAAMVLYAAQSLLMVTIVLQGLKKFAPDAIFATISILLLIFARWTETACDWLKLPYAYQVAGLGITATDIAHLATIGIVAALAVLRFKQESVNRAIFYNTQEGELEQARELQEHVLLPEEIHSAYFNVECAYHPLQIVGGDFFQTMVGLDGSLLVVIGDVSGKGLSAAMLVAVLVGAVRTRGNESFDPASMLATLNTILMGRTGGNLATCLVAHLRPNGQIRLANAGHMTPYLNGVELDLSGSLPLGMAAAIEPATQLFELSAGDELTFLTDGVVKAKNRKGELFGFELACSVSRESASAIASQAKDFGQDDDITVIRVGFTGAPIETISRTYTFARD